MGAIIDWISISLKHDLPVLPVMPGFEELWKTPAGEGEKWLQDYLSSFTDMAIMHGRSPYRKSIMSEYGGWRLFWDCDQGGSLVEFTGQGCKRLRDQGWDVDVVNAFYDRITRIDLAVDIETDCDPQEFTERCDNKKFKSGAVMTSSGGKTVYVGSRKSDRYARVYRYAEPHPRAKFLRVEMVCKGRSALPTCELIRAGYDIVSVAAAVGKAYKWSHPLWDMASEITAVAAPRRWHASQTERWLITQVLPAISKLTRKGQLEVVEYLRDQIDILLRLSLIHI